MNSLLLQAALRPLMGVQLFLSFYFLFRGHHLPGGGFIGGLIGASAFILAAIAESPTWARRVLRIAPPRIMAIGLLLSLLSGGIALALDRAYLSAIWLGNVGTPLLFDIGVYLLVFGFTTLTAFTIFESSDPRESVR